MQGEWGGGGGGGGLLGMWLGIELVGKESVCNVALFPLTISLKCLWQALNDH